MTRRLGALAVLLVAGCAPSLSELKPTLAATDTGTIWFTGGDSIVLSGYLRRSWGRS